VFKFHDDPTVNESEIIVFLRHVWWSARKERVLEGEERKMKMGERGSIVGPKIRDG